MLSSSIVTLITGVYMWFNQIMNPMVPFQEADLEKYFTPDFVMEMNGKEITKDYASLFAHFKKFRENGAAINVEIPFRELVISEDKQKCVVRYDITKTYKDKLPQNIKVIAIWHISKDGRLSRMNEVVYFEDVSATGDKH